MLKPSLFDEILKKELTRREFLLHLGAGVLAMIGIGNVLKALLGPHGNQAKSDRGYGAGPYGR